MERVYERCCGLDRIQKLLESANIKLASVATDVVGASGRAMLKALIGGQHHPEQLANLAKGNPTGQARPSGRGAERFAITTPS